MAEYSEKRFELVQRNRSREGSTMPCAHYHHHHELYYLEKGKTQYYIGNEVFQLIPGDMIFVPKEAFHWTSSVAEHGVERVLITFDDDYLPAEYGSFIQELSERKHIRIQQDKQPLIKNLLQEIEQEERKKQPEYREVQRLYVQHLLILLKRYRTEAIAVYERPSQRLIQSAAQYISEHYDQPISLQMIAAHFALSPTHFSRQFKKVTGTALSEYINIVRITAAQAMLKKPSATVTQTAHACGFNDSIYFAQVFKRLLGISPKRYAMQSSRG